MRSNQQLKNKKNVAHEDVQNEHDMKNNIVATHLELNFINKMSSLWTLYLEFYKWNWVVLGGYKKLEEMSSTFINKLLSFTTWTMDKIEPKVADDGLPKQLDMCSNLKTAWATRVHLRLY